MSSEFYFDQDNFFSSAPNTCQHTSTDLISIRNCSIWFLSIIWKYNKYSENQIIYGKNENVNYTSNLNNQLLSQNIQSTLPIDFSLAQQFVYEKNIEKIKFSIKYDIEEYDCPIKYLNKDYSNYNFEIYINANIHNIPMLKENINFIVKGYDILKTIQNKLVEIKSQKLCNNFSAGEKKQDLSLTKNNENNDFKDNFNQSECPINKNANAFYNPKAVYAKIFSNMNFSFAIEFSMENFMLDVSSINFTNIAHSNIVINKIFIEYFVPLCVLLPRIPENLTKFTNLNYYPGYTNNTNDNFNKQNFYKKKSYYNNMRYTRNNNPQNFNNSNYQSNNNFSNKSYYTNNNYFNQNTTTNDIRFPNNQINMNMRNNIENVHSKGNFVDNRSIKYNYNFNAYPRRNNNNKGHINNSDFFLINQNQIINHMKRNFTNYNDNIFQNNLPDNINKNFNCQNFTQINKLIQNENPYKNNNSTINDNDELNISNKPIQSNPLKGTSVNRDYALKFEKMVDFIPKNFICYSQTNNYSTSSNLGNKNKDIKDSNNNPNKIINNQINNQENASMDSSMISMRTTTSLISNNEDDEINFLQNPRNNFNNYPNNPNYDNNNHISNDNQKSQYDNYFNSFGNQKKFGNQNYKDLYAGNNYVRNNKLNSDFFENENNLNAEFNYFSNLQNNFNNVYCPIIVSPKTCNININLNPQIYGNILIGNNQDFANYYMHNSESQEPKNVIDDNLSLSSNSDINNKHNLNYPLNARSTNKTDNLPNPNSNHKVNLNLKNYQSLLTPPKNLKPEKNKRQNYIQVERNNKLNNKLINSNNTINNNPNFINQLNLSYQTPYGIMQNITNKFADDIGAFPQIKNNKHNFCNWFSFMTNTTPLMLNHEDLTLKSFFSSFEKPSIFGVDCLFKFNNSYFHKTFHPSFSAINIELLTEQPSNTTNTIIPNNQSIITSTGCENLNNLSNLNSTLDGSFYSYVSESEQANAAKLQNTVFFIEDLAMHLRPLFCDKAQEFLESHELLNVSVAEVSENSWFSVLWTPEKNKENSHLEANACFLVFYRIKPAACDSKIGFLPVIGVSSGKFGDEIFWFSNQASVQVLVNKGNFQKMKEDYYSNRIEYLQISENIENLVGKNKLSLIHDMIVLSRN